MRAFTNTGTKAALLMLVFVVAFLVSSEHRVPEVLPIALVLLCSLLHLAHGDGHGRHDGAEGHG